MFLVRLDIYMSIEYLNDRVEQNGFRDRIANSSTQLAWNRVVIIVLFVVKQQRVLWSWFLQHSSNVTFAKLKSLHLKRRLLLRIACAYLLFKTFS